VATKRVLNKLRYYDTYTSAAVLLTRRRGSSLIQQNKSSALFDNLTSPRKPQVVTVHENPRLQYIGAECFAYLDESRVIEASPGAGVMTSEATDKD
jgi:hypothetical protein